MVLSILIHFQIEKGLDLAVTESLQKVVPRFFDGPLSLFSILGSAEITCGIWAVVALILAYKRKWVILLWLFTFWLGLAIEIVNKHWLVHPGPPKEFFRSIVPFLPSKYIHTNYSYPSGHAYRTVYLLLLSNLFIKNRKWVYLVCITIFLMILSRVYLGEHWLSDTLGGALLGWTMVSITVYGISHGVIEKYYGRFFK